MLYAIVKKELQQILRARLLQAAALCLLVLMGLSLAVSYSYNRLLDSRVETANEAARQHWETQGDKNQHSAAHYGVYLFKPKSALSFWDHGIEKYVGSTVFVEAHKRNHPHFKPVEDAPMLAKWGELTPSFVLLCLLPLLMVWLCAGAVSAEREGRTLHFVLSQGVSWRQLLLGKALARWLVALVLILPSFLAMAVLLGRFEGAIGGEPGVWALLLMVYLLYIGIFIQAGIAISARTGSTAASTLAMLGFWLLSVWVVPRLGSSLSEAFYPSPPATAFDAAIEEAIAEQGIKRHDPNNPQTVAFTRKTLETYGVDSIEALPVNFNGLILQAAEERNDRIFDRHHRALEERHRQQTDFIQWMGLFSPFLPARQLSMGLCKTGLHSAMDFEEKADQYRKAFIKALNEDLIRSGPVRAQRFVRERSFWKNLPEFSYRPPGLAFTLEHYWPNLLALLLWFGLTAGALFFSTPQKW